MTLHDHIAAATTLAAQLTEKAETLPYPELAPIADQLQAMDVALGLSSLGDLLGDIEAAAAPPPPIGESAPALELWRRAVLEGRPVSDKMTRAAAWELTAIECERAGNTHGAERARREAAYIVGVRGVA